MHPLLSFSLTCAVFYSLALLFYPLLRWRHPFLPVAISVVLMLLIESINLIPREQVVTRALASLLCGEAFFCAVDFMRDQHRSVYKASFKEYLQFLIPFPPLLVVFRAKQQRLSSPASVRLELRRILIALPISVLAFLLALSTHLVDVFKHYFLLDHCVKLFLFVVFIESLAQWVNGLERLLGFATPPIVNRCYRSRTPGEFWQRYNVRIHDWLYRNVFLTSGGRRKPLRGMMFVFLFSAVLHELFFGIATSRFTGYQATFFLLQIPAVAISRRMERLAIAWGSFGNVLARVITVLWFTVTSMLFFHGIEQVFHFYYASEPWLK